MPRICPLMVTDDAYLSGEAGSLGVATEEVVGAGEWAWGVLEDSRCSQRLRCYSYATVTTRIPIVETRMLPSRNLGSRLRS